MKNIQKLTKPTISFNGNDGQTLFNEVVEAYKKSNELIELIAGAQYTDGRNSDNPEQYKAMRNEKREIIDNLHHLSDLLIGLAIDINKTT